MTWEVRVEGGQDGHLVEAGFVDAVAAARRARRYERRTGRRHWAKESPRLLPSAEGRLPGTTPGGCVYFYSLTSSGAGS